MPQTLTAPHNLQKDRATDHPFDKSAVDHDVEKTFDDEDLEYKKFLMKRLEKARRLNDQAHADFGDLTRHEYYEENIKIANTLSFKAKKNKTDVDVQSGTVESKLDALLSNINNLNLATEVHAFDRDDNEIVEAGAAIEDIIAKTKQNEIGGDTTGDEEKRIARQRELLVQGTVFVQEEWLKKWEIKKKLKGKYQGEFKGVEWDEELVKVFEGPNKTLLHGPNVYLGDITEYSMENQPFIFVVTRMSYDTAKAKYGKFENWKHVKRGKATSFAKSETTNLFDNTQLLSEIRDDQVEIIMYQDQGRDEFNILINGIMMMPTQFPLSAVTPDGTYNVVKQIFRTFRNDFAFGKSFVSSGSIRQLSKLIDEMLNLFVLKTRKSITPPYLNISGRVINPKVLQPGRISMGIDPGVLQPVAGQEVQGVTAGEYGFIDRLSQTIDRSTVSPVFTGNSEQGTQTATEVLQLKQQAELTLGLTITVCALLEQKLDNKRLHNILKNWFEPIGEKVVEINGARKKIKKFRNVSREVQVEGEGLTERTIIPTDEPVPSSREIRNVEIAESKKKGRPVRKIVINRKELANADLLWYTVVTPKEKETSALFKVSFREMLADMVSLTQLGSVPNRASLEEEFAKAWGKKKARLFQDTNSAQPQGGPQALAVGQKVNTPAQNEQAQGRSGASSDAALPAGALV